LTFEGGRAYSIKRLNQTHGLHVTGHGHGTRAATRKIREPAASTKARVLLAAEEVFATRGFAGASTREIAARAGVNISSLHYHWESKDRLYEAVLHTVYSRVTELSRDSASAFTARAELSREAHETSVGQVFDYFAANPSVPRLLLRHLLEEADAGGVSNSDGFLEPWTREIGGWVKHRGAKRGRDVDVQIVALTLFAALLLFTLDTRLHARLLGGHVADPEITRRLRGHLTELGARLVAGDPKTAP
jgi:AcrR family transcriptional regulator